jgi:hypothetical protein
VPKATGTGFDTVSTSFVRKTDSTGVLKFKFLASQFGGVERIKARLVSDSTRFDTLSLMTRVPGLELLPVGNKYVKVGGTCEHHGPSDRTSVADSCKLRDHNHFAATVVRDSLPLMAQVWLDSLRQDTLFVNDIGLPYGGMFDVDGDWRPEHTEHREGKDADLRTAIPTGQNARRGIKVRNAAGETVDNTKFESQAKRFGAKAKIHKRQTIYEHYHLDYR